MECRGLQLLHMSLINLPRAIVFVSSPALPETFFPRCVVWNLNWDMAAPPPLPLPRRLKTLILIIHHEVRPHVSQCSILSPFGPPILHALLGPPCQQIGLNLGPNSGDIRSKPPRSRPPVTRLSSAFPLIPIARRIGRMDHRWFLRSPCFRPFFHFRILS